MNKEEYKELFKDLSWLNTQINKVIQMCDFKALKDFREIRQRKEDLLLNYFKENKENKTNSKSKLPWEYEYKSKHR